jgi:hypothetical protein
MLSYEKRYEVALDTSHHTLNIKVWGDWDVGDIELAEHFDRELHEKVEEVSHEGEEWSVCEDFIGLHPRPREVCRIMGDGIVFAVRNGLKKAIHCHETLGGEHETRRLVSSKGL